MSLWKYSFELTTRELELTKKKKNALDSLFASGKISQSTFDSLQLELAENIDDLESHLKSLKDKMTIRSQELESQISTLELFLASLEIHHAAGDVTNETYEQQNNAILLGIEATRKEIDEIKSSLEKTRGESETPEEQEVSTKVSSSKEAEEESQVEEPILEETLGLESEEAEATESGVSPLTSYTEES